MMTLATILVAVVAGLTYGFVSGSLAKSGLWIFWARPLAYAFAAVFACSPAGLPVVAVQVIGCVALGAGYVQALVETAAE